MLRKYTAIFFITIAYVIVLGHSIIPHHHQHEHDHKHNHNQVGIAVHHSHDHHHESDSKTIDLGDLFSQLFHAPDDFTYKNSHSFSINFSQRLNLQVAELPDNFSLEDFDIPPLLQWTSSGMINYTSPYSHLSGMRAPPAIFI